MFLVTNENMGLCLYINTYTEFGKIVVGKFTIRSNVKIKHQEVTNIKKIWIFFGGKDIFPKCQQAFGDLPAFRSSTCVICRLGDLMEHFVKNWRGV